MQDKKLGPSKKKAHLDAIGDDELADQDVGGGLGNGHPSALLCGRAADLPALAVGKDLVAPLLFDEERCWLRTHFRAVLGRKRPQSSFLLVRVESSLLKRCRSRARPPGVEHTAGSGRVAPGGA